MEKEEEKLLEKEEEKIMQKYYKRGPGEAKRMAQKKKLRETKS